MRHLASPQNPEIKAIARLRERRERQREGLFLIEGARELSRALEAGVPVRTVYVCEALLRPEGQQLLARLDEPALGGPEVVTTSPAAHAKLSARENPDGLIGVASPWERASPEITDQALVFVLSGLEKPGNVGALLRVADGAGVDAALLTGGGVDLYNPNVVRASQGSVFGVPCLELDDAAALAWLRGRGFKLAALTPGGAVPYWNADLGGKLALILGAEHAGVPPFWTAAADLALSIPMRGAADSLNVATAGALALYEALRQRSHV